MNNKFALKVTESNLINHSQCEYNENTLFFYKKHLRKSKKSCNFAPDFNNNIMSNPFI